MISHKINVKQVLVAQIFPFNKFEFLGLVYDKAYDLFGWNGGQQCLDDIPGFLIGRVFNRITIYLSWLFGPLDCWL